MGYFSDVNNTISPYEIKTITVDKNGAAFGVQGSGGAIIITTK